MIKKITSKRDTATRHDALAGLLRLSQQQGVLRPAICNHGGIELFITNMKKAGGGHTRHGLPFLFGVKMFIF